MFGEFFSYVNVFKVFRPFFPLRRIILEVLAFPFEYIFATPLLLPSSLSFLITHRCNLSCECCFDKDYRNKEDMTFAKFAAFLESFPKRYKPAMFFSGGEPFLHPEVFEFFKICKQKKMPFGVVTNGMMPLPSWEEKMQDCVPDLMVFSVHGSLAVHDKVVGKEGAFARLCDNVVIIGEKFPETKIIFNYIFNEDSFSAEDVKAFILSLAEKNIFPDDIRFNHLNYVLPNELQAQKSCKELKDFEDVQYRLNPVSDHPVEQNYEKFISFKAVLAAYKNIYNFSFKPYLSDKQVHSWYSKSFNSKKRKCFFPLKSLSFDSNGKAFFCQKIYFKSAFMGETDIKKIWYGKEAKMFRKYLRKKLFPVCHRCCKL